jgi:hypothetical protein
MVKIVLNIESSTQQSVARTKVTLGVVTSGYSSTPLAAKIGIKEGHRVLLVHAPRDWSLDDLPSNVKVARRRSETKADVAIAFFRDAATLTRSMASLANAITPDGSLWTAWPRRAAGHVSDITDHVVRSAVLPLGLVDVKVAALDEDWSAIKMVWRKELRAKLRSPH